MSNGVLGTLSGVSSRAYGINNNDQVVGQATIAGGHWRGFRWENGTMIDLSTLGGTESAAYAVNDSDQIVGWSDMASGYRHAALYESGAWIDLGTLDGQLCPWWKSITLVILKRCIGVPWIRSLERADARRATQLRPKWVTAKMSIHINAYR